MEESSFTTEVCKRLDNNAVVASGRLTNDCIHDLETDPEYRCRGFASEIIRALILLGGRRLWVESTNSAAISLYMKLGFAISKYEQGYYEMRLS